MSATSQERVVSSAMEVDGEIDRWGCKDIWHCPRCQVALRHDALNPSMFCPGCGARLPIENDILIVKELTSANNQVAQVFTTARSGPSFVSGNGSRGFATAASAAPATRS